MPCVCDNQKQYLYVLAIEKYSQFKKRNYMTICHSQKNIIASCFPTSYNLKTRFMFVHAYLGHSKLQSTPTNTTVILTFGALG